jgi:flagellar motor switch protein FliM
MNTELPPMPKGEAMSQAEVERLLVATAENATAADALTAAKEPVPDGQSPQRHEFPQISSFSALELRTLKARHEEYMRALASQLSGHLRSECLVQMTKLETVRFQPWIDSLPNPTHLALFRLDPPGSVCLLEIPPRLGLSVIDRELGGPGVFPDDLRELTQMEIRLLCRVIDVFTKEWCNVWRDALELRPVLLRHETCPQFVRPHAPDVVLLALGIEIRMGDLMEQVQMAFPHSLLEQILLKLDPEADGKKKANTARPAALPQWNPGFNNIEMRVSAEWFGMEMTAGQLGELKPGDILPVSAATAGRVRVLVDAAPKFVGDLGKCGQQWAVKISGKHGG